jgi:hypothetical protein
VIAAERQPGNRATVAAIRLRQALAWHWIWADVHPDARLALVSVCAGLVVWTDGHWYRWWTGHNCERTGRRIYAYGSADNPGGVALWLVTRHVELESNGLLSPVLTGARP